MPIPVSQAVLEGIIAVRDSGATNMLDRNTVIQLCGDMGFYEAAVWIQEHKCEYSHGIFEGFQAADGNADDSKGGET